MKLGVTYIVFDGIELLESSIDQIREHVDYLQVIYQSVSWFGMPIDPNNVFILKRLLSLGKIDELSLFSGFAPLPSAAPNTIQRAKSYEREKRQLGLTSCLKRGCTHYLCMDVDEFYKSDEFAKAKEDVIANDYTQTAVRFINYVNVPTVHRGYDSSRVPFICKINTSSKMSSRFFVKCDPTRGVECSAAKKHEFAPSVVTMHHMETVRKNLNAKYASTTRAVFNRSRTPELIDNIKQINNESTSFSFNKIIFPGIGSVKLTHCENTFNIPYLTW